MNSGCVSPEHRLLQQADSVIIDHPDSAMAILNRIDPLKLGKSELPYYALLFTQAQVETGVEVTSDFLIRTAIEKYGADLRGDKGIRANFYCGEVYRQHSGGGKALIHYLRAYETAKRLGNHYWHAWAAKRIKLHFCWIQNFYEGERYAREVVDQFKKAGRSREHRIAVIDHAQLYEPLGKFDLEREILDSLRHVCVTEHPADSSVLRRIDYELNHMEWRKEYMENTGYNPLFAVMVNKGDRDLVEEINGTRRDYYESLAKKSADDAVLFHRLLWVAIAVFLTILVLMIRTFYLRNKVQEARRAAVFESFLSLKAESRKAQEDSTPSTSLPVKGADGNDENLETLKQEVDEKTAALERMRNELEASRQTEHSSNEMVRNLLKERWRTLDMLCDELFDAGRSDIERKRVVRNIERELKKIMSPQGIRETLDAVDIHMDGIVSRLCEQCPWLREADVNFLGLIYAGFSVRAVCMFTGMEYQYFYVKKSRLIKRIQNSGVTDKDLFIAPLRKENMSVNDVGQQENSLTPDGSEPDKQLSDS